MHGYGRMLWAIEKQQSRIRNQSIRRHVNGRSRQIRMRNYGSDGQSESTWLRCVLVAARLLHAHSVPCAAVVRRHDCGTQTRAVCTATLSALCTTECKCKCKCKCK